MQMDRRKRHDLRVDVDGGQRRGHDPGFRRVIKAAQKDVPRNGFAQLAQRLHGVHRIPMSFIMNDGGQDPYILINGFGEGYGDPDTWKHLVVTDEGKVVSDATSEGFKKGTEWLHKLYEQNLGEVKLRVILDRFSVEVFVNDGEAAASAVIYTRQEADAITFEAGGQALIDVEKYDLILDGEN